MTAVLITVALLLGLYAWGAGPSWIWRRLLRPQVSQAVNWALYGFRRIVLQQPAARARREHHAGHAANEADRKERESKPNIAVANRNLGKYTETFVDRHVQTLRDAGYYVHRLHGGDLPTMEQRRGIIEGSAATMRYHRWKEELLGLAPDFYLRKALGSYLRRHGIRLVLAEFGPCAACLAPVCEKEGVPLVAVFHGYDAHHGPTLAEQAEAYRNLFRTAAAIICVSQDIRQRLIALGAPADKLTHLPCGVDLERCAYSDHSSNPPVLLSVGRFADTKAPHLLLLAFRDLLAHVPDARLVMVGKDGGGELFEACHSLAHALGISSSVQFKGVLSHDEVLAEMRSARALLQHSITTPLTGDREGTPVAVLEALASGLPVIATRHAGIAEMADDGITAILADEYDLRAFSEAMHRICTDDALAFSLGKDAAAAMRANPLIANNANLLAELTNKHLRSE